MFIEACFFPYKPQVQQCPICPSLEFAFRSVITINFPAFHGRSFIHHLHWEKPGLFGNTHYPTDSDFVKAVGRNFATTGKALSGNWLP